MFSFIIVILLLLWKTDALDATKQEYSKCGLSDDALFHIPQYVINENKALTLTISSSSRPSHRIVSHLLHILMTEGLGYKDVAIITQASTSTHASDLLTLVTNNLEKSNKTPPFMVNLEVWLPPGLSLENMNISSGTLNMSSAGPLGPVAQYGWFVRSRTSQAFWNLRQKPIDHYRIWTNLNITKHFHGDSNSDALLTFQNDAKLNTNLFLTMDEVIRKMSLKVKIDQTKGNSTESIISDLLRLNKSDKSNEKLVTSNDDMLLFTWFPNTITSRFQFQRVSFSAPCSLSFKSGMMKPLVQPNIPCDPFPVFQMTKWVWKGLKKAAPMAHDLIQKIFLSQTTYEGLLKQVNVSEKNPTKMNSMYRNIACNWLKKNNAKWEKWLPKRPETVKIWLGGIFPKDGGKWYDKHLLSGAEKSVKEANAKVLKGYPYEIKLLPHNVSCEKQDEALFHYNQIVMDKCGQTRRYLLGVLAASCSASIEPMILLNKHYKAVIISPTVESGKYTQIKLYPNFFRTVPDMQQYSNYLVGTFKQLEWRRAALFRKDDHFVNKQAFDGKDVKIVHDYETDEEELKLENVLRDLKRAKIENNARIFVVEYFAKGTSLVLCAATKLNMTAKKGYVWFLNPWITDNFLHKKSVQDFYLGADSKDCSLDKMLETIRFYFVLTHLSSLPTKKHVKGSKYYPYVSDAVFVFAHGLKKFAGNDTKKLTLLNDMNNATVSKKWLDIIANTSFLNEENQVVKFNKSRRARPISDKPYQLFEYICDPTTKDCKPLKVGYWKREKEGPDNLGKFYDIDNDCSDCERINWLNGPRPGDGTREEDNCFWPGLATTKFGCALPIGVVIFSVIGGIVFIVLILYCLLRPHYNQLKEAKRQLAPFSDILNDLQPLELKSFQIVLNLPLGEGAFGTVRGGEAKLDGQWHAVAVKTLHERATQEEKMEFLSEARIMKEFHHRNIVKLLGVRAQSKSEPYMTVMEFMLYGDMKKYLIARHVLAKEEPNHADISPTSLTSMTVDIISGLGYLHEQGYIHRDLALRNCLVGNNRQVKLCDFGLTRQVNDGRDYYRFERRGMLPVRWMAPESLHSGVFTIKSDIWSFGVVLYEIVTFGNKPYRDKRNEDVIDCMRLGSDCLIRYLNRPEENLPKLLTLMRECFHYYPHERPDSQHILNYLLSDQCCVRPCLEEVPPDPGELPAGLLGPDTGERRRGGSGGGGNAGTDRIRFHSGRNSVPSNTGLDSVFIDQNSTASGLAQHSGLNSSFPPPAIAAARNAAFSAAVNGARNSTSSNTAVPNDVRNYASTEFIPMRPTRSLSGGLGEENSPDNASPTTGLLETEISIGSEVDALASCDYDAPSVTFSPFANGATPHSRASMGLGSSLGSLHSRLTHAS